MKIDRPFLTVMDGNFVRLSADITIDGQKQILWYQVEKQYADYLVRENSDAFLVALLVLAMKRGEDIFIDGAISEKLLYNLTNYYMRIIISIIPSLHIVKITPEGIRKEKLENAKPFVGTGFSGGIDSFCLIGDHLLGQTLPSYKVTHLIFNNVGSHGSGMHRLFEERRQRLLPLVNQWDIPLVSIDSNLDAILEINFERTLLLRNVSAVLALQKMFSKYLFASSYKYEDCYVGKAKHDARADPFTVHLLSTETTECISAGCQYSRVEKTVRVAEIEASYKYLDVCVSPDAGGNCSQCFKCCRTLLTLELIGKLSNYSSIFDLEKYHKIRKSYIAEVVSSSDPFTREIAILAAERGVLFPLSSRLVGAISRRLDFVKRKLPKDFRKMVRRLLLGQAQK